MADEITDAQIAELRADLLTLKAELEALMDTTGEGTRPVDLDEPIGRLSRMDAIQQQKMAQANRARNAVRLRMVIAALAADPVDEYGWCKRCEDPVGYGRLKSRPEAPFCVACQGAMERRT
ncbi:MAG: TraR/DksA C4-type zinc finger protein [Myxococcota bacterium]|nr:TraR/DksA C4-type zinc finger protein [Myxococcota bacterium]